VKNVFVRAMFSKELNLLRFGASASEDPVASYTGPTAVDDLGSILQNYISARIFFRI
jgi:hypothetical protein